MKRTTRQIARINLFMFDLSVIMVNYNTSQLLRRCLGSVIHHTADVEYELIVVDNASSDDSLNMLKTEFPAVRVIAKQRKPWFWRREQSGY